MKERNPSQSTCFLFNRDDIAAAKNPILGAESYSFWFNPAAGHVISICKEHRGDPLHPRATHVRMLYVWGALNDAIHKFVFADFGFPLDGVKETDDPQASARGFRCFVEYAREGIDDA